MKVGDLVNEDLIMNSALSCGKSEVLKCSRNAIKVGRLLVSGDTSRAITPLVWR